MRRSLLRVENGAECGRFVEAVAQFQIRGGLDEPGHDGILAGPVADSHEHAAGQTALARTAVTGADQGGQAAGQVGVGQDDQVVLGAAQGLHALAMGRRGAVDVLGHRGRTDKRHSLDMGVADQPFADFLAALDHADDARGQTGLGEQFDQTRPGHAAPFPRASG